MRPKYLYLLTYFRLMPVYGLMIAFHTFVLLHLADGPLWKKIAIQESDYCQNNWWSNLLFINNYVDADRPVSFFFIKQDVLNISQFPVHYSIVVFGMWHAILHRRYYTCLFRVEVPKIWSLLDVGNDIFFVFNSCLCRIYSSVLSDIFELYFVSNRILLHDVIKSLFILIRKWNI